jgi:cytochrome c-type biogenesis protein CcmH
MLWLIFSAFILLALLSILWPLIKAPRGASAQAFDVEVYRGQVAEIDRDEAQGLIAPQDAQGAKAEAGRRLLDATKGFEAPLAKKNPPWRALAVAIAGLFLVPALALTFYLSIGHPNLPDLPLAARFDAAPGRTDMAAAIAKVEAHLKQNPDDGRGYEVLAPVYFRLGRAREAVMAYSEALRLLGPTPERHTHLGEAFVLAANGVVTDEAIKQFEAALAGDPEAKKPRFFLGLAAEQKNDFAGAQKYWTKLAEEEPPNSPLAEALRRRMGKPATEAPQSAVAAQIEAMPRAEQQKAIRAMVGRLAARLAKEGGDVESWLRLVRAYAVLEERDLARKAVVEARRNLASDAPAIARIDDLARELGLEG